MYEENDIPRHHKKSAKKKTFGIQFSNYHNIRWYLTEKARNQAFDLCLKAESPIIGIPKKVNR